MQAKRLERYTISQDSSAREFIIYSSLGGEDINKILSFTEGTMEKAGYDGEVMKYISHDSFRERVQREMDKPKQYILLDINISKLVINRDTIVIRIGTKDNPKLQENLEYGNMIRDALKDRGIKVNILKDSTGNYNQDLGYRSIQITISSNHDYQSASLLIGELAKVLIN
jgi:hypothetical protein